MYPLPGIDAYTPLVSIGTNGTVSPTYGLLAAELSLSSPAPFSSTSAIVELSGLGQLLSAAAIFQDQLQSLQPGTATSGGGQNFGTDFASLAAETQSLADAFNNLQSNITSVNGTSNLLGGNVTSASGLSQSLDAQAQANYANGASTLTNLAQLGIAYQPPLLAGGGGSLSIDLNKLQSAFNADAAGAFSLLSLAAHAFTGIAGDFVGQASSQYSSLSVLAQTTSGSGFFNSPLSPAQSSFTGLANLQALETLTGGANLQQLILAMNEYAMVSTLFG